MKRFLRRIHLDDKGFTMMELLIVVALIGVLAAVVVPNVGRFIGRGEEEAAISELRMVQAATDAAMVEFGIGPGHFPSNITARSDFITVAISGNHTLYPDFLRTRFAGAQKRDGSRATYEWTDDGKVKSSAIDANTGRWYYP